MQMKYPEALSNQSVDDLPWPPMTLEHPRGIVARRALHDTGGETRVFLWMGIEVTNSIAEC
jgi:hypothetical protein